MDAGFRILSVNDREEITALSSRYPEVLFVATDRNASAWSGRKNPYIADLLLALKDADEPVVGIINSDLVFESSAMWRERLPSLVSDTVIAGQRYDTTSLSNGIFRRFWPGFDFFFFDRAIADALGEIAMPFAMGLPFWDYWFPAAAAIRKRRVLVVDRPGAAHLMHGHGYQHSTLCKFAQIFSKSILRETEAAESAPEFVAPIIPICREIDALRNDAENSELEILKRTNEILALLPSRMRENAIRFETTNAEIHAAHPAGRADDSGTSPMFERSQIASSIFHRFDRRLAAGEAFERAKALQHQGRLADAEREYEMALGEAPEDFDVLLSFGEFLYLRGQKDRACHLLGMAVHQQPDSPRPLNSLGVALHALGRHDDAIASFEKLLRIDRTFKDAYLSLSFVLSERGRIREALDYLGQALAEWPDFPEAAKLRAHISRIAAR